MGRRKGAGQRLGESRWAGGVTIDGLAGRKGRDGLCASIFRQCVLSDDLGNYVVCVNVIWCRLGFEDITAFSVRSAETVASVGRSILTQNWAVKFSNQMSAPT